MSAPELEIRQGIERFYAAVSRHEWDAAVGELDPDVQYTPVEENVECRGREALLDYFQRWYELWEGDETHAEEIEVAPSGDRSFVAMRFTARGRGSGIPVDGLFFHVAELREGRLHRIAEYQDRDEARAAFEAAQLSNHD